MKKKSTFSLLVKYLLILGIICFFEVFIFGEFSIILIPITIIFYGSFVNLLETNDKPKKYESIIEEVSEDKNEKIPKKKLDNITSKINNYEVYFSDLFIACISLFLGFIFGEVGDYDGGYFDLTIFAILFWFIGFYFLFFLLKRTFFSLINKEKMAFIYSLFLIIFLFFTSTFLFEWYYDVREFSKEEILENPFKYVSFNDISGPYFIKDRMGTYEIDGMGYKFYYITPNIERTSREPIRINVDNIKVYYEKELICYSNIKQELLIVGGSYKKTRRSIGVSCLKDINNYKKEKLNIIINTNLGDAQFNIDKFKTFFI